MNIDLIFIFLAGAMAFGSFSNACAYRFYSKESLMERSHCPHCKHKLNIIDLIPLFGFLLLRGHCRYCGVSISRQYPAMELLHGITAVLLYLYFGNTYIMLILFMLMFCVYLLIGIALNKEKYMMKIDRKSAHMMIIVAFLMNLYCLPVFAEAPPAEDVSNVEEEIYYLEEPQTEATKAVGDGEGVEKQAKNKALANSETPKIIGEGGTALVSENETVIVKTKSELNREKVEKALNVSYLGIKKRQWLEEIYIIKNIKTEEREEFFKYLNCAEKNWYMKQMVFQTKDKKRLSPIYMYHKKNLERLKLEPIRLKSSKPIYLEETSLFTLIDVMYYTYHFRPETSIPELADVIVYTSGMISRGLSPLRAKDLVINKLENKTPIPVMLEYLLDETPLDY